MYVEGKNKLKSEKVSGISGPIKSGNAFIECKKVKDTSDLYIHFPDIPENKIDVSIIKIIKKGFEVLACKEAEGKKFEWILIDY